MGRLMKSGICYTGSGGGGSITYNELTLAEYQELTYEQKHNGELYFITDVNGDMPNAKEIVIIHEQIS